MKKSIALTFGLLLLSSLLLSPVSLVGSITLLPTKDENRIYIDDSNAYISATPHTLHADGYVYLNITSKNYGEEVDICFGFDSKLAYPRSLELYDPKSETTQHELDLNPYWDNPDYKIEFSNITSKQDKTLHDGSVLVYHNNSIKNERNQTIGWQWTKILHKQYSIENLDTRTVNWNTTYTSEWSSIQNMDFDKKSFSFEGMDTWYLGNVTIEKNRETFMRMWLTLVPTLNDTVHEYYVGLKPHQETLEQAVANNHFYCLDPWYDSNWQYRKGHIINYASGAGTNYQVQIMVHYGSGTDSGEDVYLSGKCQSDFGDIRFTDDNETTLLDYWLMEKTDSNYAIFWIEIADDLSSSNATIYIYYGNDAVSTTSDFDDTFIFGDPFDDSTLNTDRWTSVDGNPTYSIDTSNHWLEVTDMDTYTWDSYYGFHSKTFTYPSQYVVEDAYGDSDGFLLYEETSSANDYNSGYMSVHHTTMSGADRGVAAVVLLDAVVSQSYYYGTLVGGGSTDWNSGWISGASFTVKSKIYKLSGTIYVDFDGTNRHSESNSETPDRFHMAVERYQTFAFGTQRFGAFRIRKYVSPEPSHGEWDSEEEQDQDPPISPPAGAWLTGWRYRKIHTITSASGAGTDYPVKITVYYDNLTDFGRNVHLDGKCQSDFDDIRFTDNDGETLLDYWLENKVDEDYATFWVKIADNLSSSNTTLCVYYGNDDAERADNPLDLDLFQIREYDLYSSASYDPNYVFSKNTSSILLSDSYSAGSSSMGKGYFFIQALKDDLDGKKIQVSWRCYFSYTSEWTLGSVWVVDNPHLRSDIAGEFEDSDDTEHPVSDYTNTLLFTIQNSGYGWTSWNTSTSGVLDLSGFSSEYVTILISAAKDAWIAQTVMLDIDYLKILYSNSTVFKTYDFDESVVMEQTGTLRDYGLYRKYVYPEPTHGAWGNEEEYKVAFRIWGTQKYVVDVSLESTFQVNGINYTAYYSGNATDELAWSKNITDYIETCVDGTQRYDLKNGWGNSTIDNYVYANISDTAENCSYTAVFYKGHTTWSFPNATHNHFHWNIFANDTAIEKIWDHYIYDNMSNTFTHDFVFLWTCFLGKNDTDTLGTIESDHSWGMLASWMGVNSTEMNNDGYTNPNDSNRVFMAFNATSVDFIIPTEDTDYNYGHFVGTFFYYALDGTHTVKQALNAAAHDNFGSIDFENSELYTGYKFYYISPLNQTSMKEISALKVYGDGNHRLPN